ncbi:MAG: hypothetical protein HFI70_14915 [Lachnospiraceae bacterium]|nr:hypothetical protein [Lachnospiraceae bacterium]
MEKSITIIGGDLRQCYAAEYFRMLGWQTTCWHTPEFPFHSDIYAAGSLRDAVEHSRLILAPAPLTRDGNNLFQPESIPFHCSLDSLWAELNADHTLAALSLNDTQKQILNSKGCKTLTFGSYDFFTAENAVLTAEGLLAEVIRYTPFSLSSANMLLLGFGRCGSAIGRLFHPLCRGIYLLEQDPQRQALAKSSSLFPVTAEDLPQILPQCQILINTIPAPVLEPSALCLLHHSCHIFDIASAPCGFPEDTTRKCLLPYYRLPGIPGRFSPVTAGELIGRTIERMTEHVL